MNHAIAVDHNACILCDKCIRACDDLQVNDVIGRAGKGSKTRIAFDNDVPMGKSSCVSCGECVAACPTSALTDIKLVGINKQLSKEIRPISNQTNKEKYKKPHIELLSQNEGSEKQIDSVCPYCGVGCGISYHVQNNQILRVTGRDDAHNEGRLCVKGRYGYDFAHHPQRLLKPLIRRENAYPKEALSADFADYREFKRSLQSSDWNDRIRDVFREADWDEALDLTAGRLLNLSLIHI